MQREEIRGKMRRGETKAKKKKITYPHKLKPILYPIRLSHINLFIPFICYLYLSLTFSSSYHCSAGLSLLAQTFPPNRAREAAYRDGKLYSSLAHTFKFPYTSQAVLRGTEAAAEAVSIPGKKKFWGQTREEGKKVKHDAASLDQERRKWQVGSEREKECKSLCFQLSVS